MNNTLIIIASGFVVVFLPLGVGVFLFLSSASRQKSKKPSRSPEDKAYMVAIYAYGPDVSDMRDIAARQMSAYRDEGLISGIDDDEPIYKEAIYASLSGQNELGMINRCAVEVKRVSNADVYYFFDHLKELNIKIGQIKSIYECIKDGLSRHQAILLKLSEISLDELE
ncbi:MAG: hypothetical protein LBU32_16310 [Clostridiales bacterium]|jgi:hypothetical protein|nr:hypothetical protein [Clostridiales bacterium]